jgi:hypothetical protein
LDRIAQAGLGPHEWMCSACVPRAAEAVGYSTAESACKMM